MKISVVMACYFKEEFLKYSLRALEGQTKKPFEVIIVYDDGRAPIPLPDHKYSFDIKNIQMPGRENPKYRTSVFAFNAGLKMASGDIVVIVSPETLMGSKNLEIIQDHIFRNKEAVVTSQRFYFQRRLAYIPEFVKNHPDAIKLMRTTFYHVKHIASDHEITLQDNMVNGIYGTLKENWEKLGYFNEDHAYYGMNDSNLNDKITRSDLHHIYDSEVWGLHLWHERPPEDHMQEALERKNG
jgi:glycosyltransferase involved in cell wall biosynthesis